MDPRNFNLNDCILIMVLRSHNVPSNIHLKKRSISFLVKIFLLITMICLGQTKSNPRKRMKELKESSNEEFTCKKHF